METAKVILDVVIGGLLLFFPLYWMFFEAYKRNQETARQRLVEYSKRRRIFNNRQHHGRPQQWIGWKAE